MLDLCLNQIAPHVANLVKSDKELFYSEVKHFVRIIRWTKETKLRECTQLNKDDVEMAEEAKTTSRKLARRVNGELYSNPEYSKYTPDHLYPSL